MAHNRKMKSEHQAELKASADRRFKGVDEFANTVDVSLSTRFDPRGYFVYLLFGEDSRHPIYVGQSTNVFARVGGHFYGHGRSVEIYEVQLIRCSSKRSMDRLETALIKKYRPQLNVTHNIDDPEMASELN